MNILSVPLFVRQFAVDVIAGIAASVIALNVALPSSLSEARAQGVILIVTSIKVVFGIATRYVPAFLAYVSTVLGTATPEVSGPTVEPTDDSGELAPADIA